MGAFYSFAARLFELGFVVTGIERHVDGVENIPTEGPAILASNHVGYLDFCFVMLGPPRPRREVAFLAKSELFERRVVGSALHALRQIPVDVHGSPTDAMRAAAERLEAGGIVGLHPEGTINPAFLPMRGRSGAVRLARMTGAPIVPTAVWGSQRLLTKWRPAAWPERGVPVRVRYGAPYLPTEGSPSEATRDLMARIGVLVDELIAEDAAPPGAWWVPAERGGGAPREEEVRARLEAQRAERRARRLGTDGPST